MSRVTSVPNAAAPISPHTPVGARHSTAWRRTLGEAVHFQAEVRATCGDLDDAGDRVLRSCHRSTWVAPSSRAFASRGGTRSTATMVVQPDRRAAMIAAKPTEPAPKTAMLLPAGGRSELSTEPAPVWMPQPNGATTSNGMSVGQLARHSARWRPRTSRSSTGRSSCRGSRPPSREMRARAVRAAGAEVAGEEVGAVRRAAGEAVAGSRRRS